MSNISNQLVKDTYNYVLQSDLSTGIVYRIGGAIPINPWFQSGLTISGGFKISIGDDNSIVLPDCTMSTPLVPLNVYKTMVDALIPLNTE